MISYILKNSINEFKKAPLRIYGFTLLKTFIVLLIYVMGIIPIISIPIALLIDAGMSMLFLDVYKGQTAESKTIFSGFASARHVGGGMLWRWLWLNIWTICGALISAGLPIVGSIAGLAFAVVAVYKSYCYSFVPFILLENKNIHPMDALNRSRTLTNGYKGKMFLTDLILSIVPVLYLSLTLLIMVFAFKNGTSSAYGIVSGIMTFSLALMIMLVIAFILIVAVSMLKGVANAGYYYEIVCGTFEYRNDMYDPSFGMPNMSETHYREKINSLDNGNDPNLNSIHDNIRSGGYDDVEGVFVDGWLVDSKNTSVNEITFDSAKQEDTVKTPRRQKARKLGTKTLDIDYKGKKDINAIKEENYKRHRSRIYDKNEENNEQPKQNTRNRIY